MPTLNQPFGTRPFDALLAAAKSLGDEAAVLVVALLQPGRVVEEVERMQALHAAAARIEAKEPARAAVLRRRASVIGLR